MDSKTIFKEETPIVSIVVITYNSMPYVIETLDSIKEQTYKNIELIVSDDCSSKDNTVEAVKEWLSKNSARFVRAELVTTKKNTGIAGNCNRGCRKANGEWIKCIAGDDKLKPTYVEEMLSFCLSNRYDIACCDIENFGDSVDCVKDFWRKALNKVKSLTTAEMQHEELMKANFIPASSLIYKKEVFEEAGGYDEDCQFIEDHPYNITVTANGHCIRCLDKKLVMYRESTASVRYMPRHNMSRAIMQTKYINPCKFWYYWLKFFEYNFAAGGFFWRKGYHLYVKYGW